MNDGSSSAEESPSPMDGPAEQPSQELPAATMTVLPPPHEAAATVDMHTMLHTPAADSSSGEEVTVEGAESPPPEIIALDGTAVAPAHGVAAQPSHGQRDLPENAVQSLKPEATSPEDQSLPQPSADPECGGGHAQADAMQT
jgi:hypothetical protein